MPPTVLAAQTHKGITSREPGLCAGFPPMEKGGLGRKMQGALWDSTGIAGCGSNTLLKHSSTKSTQQFLKDFFFLVQFDFLTVS